MSRSNEFGLGRAATPEGWMRVRANTVYASKDVGTAPLVAIPKEHITSASQQHDEDHVLGYVTEHQAQAGKKSRVFRVHTAKGNTTVQLPHRAWVYIHHGQARG